MRAQLIPLDGGEPVNILRDLTVVGRKEDCDLRLDHKSVSKLHCVLVKTDGLLLLRDLGSTNGTRVNGQRVRRAALLPNDQLAIAGFKYRVFLGPDLPAAAREDHTQQLDAGDVAHLLHKLNQPAIEGTPGRPPASPMQPNLLPDLYDNEHQDSKS
jgi:predicted component of type VI protein secretion system